MPEESVPIGVRIYSAEYFLDVLPVKLAEIGALPGPWFAVRPFVEPVVRRICSERSVFPCWPINADNREVCAQAFLEGRSILVGIGCSVEGAKIAFHAANDLTRELDWFRILKQTEADAALSGKLDSRTKPVFDAALMKFYSDGLYFVELSVPNADKIGRYFIDADEDRVDVPVRLKSAPKSAEQEAVR